MTANGIAFLYFEYKLARSYNNIITNEKCDCVNIA